MTRRSATLVLVLTWLLALSAGGVEAQEAPAPTLASPATTPDPADRVAEIMADMSTREKVGQLFMTRVYGSRAASPAPAAVRANERYLGVADAQELFERFPVGAVVYFEYTGNLGRPRQIARLSNGIQRAALDAGTVPVLDRHRPGARDHRAAGTAGGPLPGLDGAGRHT